MTDHIANIKAIFNLATPTDIADGIKWYADAQATAQRIANETELPVRIVVGVIAALSPNNRWERNIADAKALCKAYLNGDAIESVRVCCYNAMRAKAWSILDRQPETDADVITILNGQKIVSFFSNIMGHDTCTIDGHALNIAIGERVALTSNKTNIGVKLYRSLQAAYADAAAQVTIAGRPLKAYEMQAITWVTWRKLHNIA